MEIAVVGGDLRQCYLADTLINAGYTVKTFDLMCDDCLLYTSPSPRDRTRSRMPSSA